MPAFSSRAAIAGLAVGALLASGCTGGDDGRRPEPSPTPTPTATSPSPSPSPDAPASGLPTPPPSIAWERDVPYGPDPRQQLDRYLPDDSVASPTGEVDRRPAIVLVHGGSWRTGDRHTLHTTAATLATTGWVAVTTDYRLAPDHPHPAAVDDVREVVEDLLAQAGDLGVDPDRVVVAGYSAGGHLAAMVALADDAPQLAGWVAWSGLYDLPFVARQVQDSAVPQLATEIGDYVGCTGPSTGSCRDQARGASPIELVSGDDPPALLLHSEDEFVPVADARTMADALEAAGAPVQLATFPGRLHGLALISNSATEVAAFLDEVAD